MTDNLAAQLGKASLKQVLRLSALEQSLIGKLEITPQILNGRTN